ncbi:hypothetical protein DVH24_011130 [Malus domestica]|uniref:Uncharacterized protein n=1 Tax=Malus domestica TaxID=3750 RepID=A0A498JUE6_MALDO|nr:hypothetical protein DVH24_011130 [Malus domestica]
MDTVSPLECFRHWCSFQSLRISPFHRKFLLPLLNSSLAFYLHAALLCYALTHCGKFPTAAPHRSLGSVSVPATNRPTLKMDCGRKFLP